MFALATSPSIPISLLLSSLVLASTALPVQSTELTPDNFNETIATGLWFVEHFSPYCRHCRKFAPTWEQLVVDSETETPSVSLAQVNCAVNGDLCDQNGIGGYPTLIMFKDGEQAETYAGLRTIDHLKEFIKGYIPKLQVQAPAVPQVEEKEEPEAPLKRNVNPTGEVIPLDQASLASTVEAGPTFVKFFAPWCGHCKKLAPIWKQLARHMQNKMNVVEVNCDDNTALCEAQGIQGYPTLMLYANGVMTEYKRGRKLDQLKEFAEKASGLGMQTLASPQDLDKHVAEEEVVYLLVNPNSDPHIQTFVREAAAPLFGSPIIYVSSSTELLSRFSLPMDTPWALIALKDNDATSPAAIYNYPNSASLESLKTWLLSQNLPTSLELSQDSFQRVMNAPSAPLVVIAAVKPVSMDVVEARLHDVAKKWRARTSGRTGREVVFTWMDNDRWADWLKKMYGAKFNRINQDLDDASLIIADHKNLIYYDTDRSGAPIKLSSMNTIFTSVEDTLAGKLPYKHSVSSIGRFANYLDDKILILKEIVLLYPITSAIVSICGSGFVIWFMYRLMSRDARALSSKASRLD